MAKRDLINIGLIGYGYWGPNLARNFSANHYCRLKRIADIDIKRRNAAKCSYPYVEVVSDSSLITRAADIDVVLIATPVFTHFDLAKDSLKNGKHVWIEKPLTSTSAQGEKVIELAEKSGLIVMVDHTFVFTGAVQMIKRLIDKGELGNIYYYDSVRVNLGLFQHDINVIWDLAPHDLSIIDYLIKDKPVAIIANGIDLFNRGLEAIAYVTIYFKNSMIAHLNLNWLSPVKIRRTIIGGQKKMLLWNDLDSDEKIKIYDKGVDIKNKEGIYNLMIEYRSGNILMPKIDHTEALKTASEYFIECIMKNKRPVNDPQAGLRVVKMLEASNRSLKNKGKLIEL